MPQPVEPELRRPPADIWAPPVASFRPRSAPATTLYRAHKSAPSRPQTDYERLHALAARTVRKRVVEGTQATHQRIRRRIQETAARFGLDPLTEETWLLEASHHMETRLKGESLGGLLSYVRTMVALRKRITGLDSPRLRAFHQGAFREDPGPDWQAEPATRAIMAELWQVLPRRQFLLFWLAWKTASRLGETVQLRGEHLVWDQNHPSEVVILWKKTTKFGKTSPWSIRNCTHLVTTPDDPIGQEMLDMLRGVGKDDHLTPYRTREMAYITLGGLPEAFGHLTGHSFKRGASDEANRVALTMPDLPAWVVSCLLKHKCQVEEEIPPNTVRYASDKRAIVARNLTGRLTERLIVPRPTSHVAADPRAA